MNSMVIFVGAGPGAVDLITLRGKSAMENADVIIYAGSLVNPELLDFARPNAIRHNSADMALDEVIAIIRASVAAGKKVVRLHTGDPSVYGAISEQMNRLDELGITYEIVPGVSSVFAAAAALKCELTMPDIGQSIILTRQAGRTPVPEAERISRLAANNASVAVFLSAGEMDSLVEEFLQAGRSPQTAAAVVYRASWPNQQIVRGTLADIAEKVRVAGIKRQAMIIVGNALNRTGAVSQLYAESFAHGYRNNDDDIPARIAVYALTGAGALKATEIAGGLRHSVLFTPESFPQPHSRSFIPERLAELLRDNWQNYDAHIFVMAAGIAVRKIVLLLQDKVTDPAVVVCDERGDYAVSLLGGHLGGANRLARRIAGITGGKPVITTATDVNGMLAFDELAAQQHWHVVNPEAIKAVNSALLSGRPVDVLLSSEIFARYFSSVPHVRRIETTAQLSGGPAVLLDQDLPEVYAAPVLRLTSARYCVGIGCRKGISAAIIENIVTQALKKLKISPKQIAVLASFEAKKQEPGLLEFARKNRLKMCFFSAGELNRYDCPNPTPRAIAEFGVNGVAEPAALAAAGSGSKLILQKYKDSGVTVAVAIGENHE